MKVLVTGAAGFVGKNLIPRLRDNQLSVVGLDKNSSKETDRVYQLGSWNRLVHESFINDNQDTSVIIHLAAESHVDRSITGPKEFVENNVSGTLELFEMARKLPNLRQIILFSTDEVGACLEEGSFTERGMDFKCGSVYSATKGAQELLAQAYTNTHGMNIITTRCVNIFGPHQADEKFLPTIIRKALANEPIPIYGNGMQMRQWVHVDHICEVLNTVAAAGYIPPGSILHITGTKELYNQMLARTVLGILGKPASLLSTVADRLGHDVRYSLAMTEETDRFGLSMYDSNERFIADLERTVEWYVANHRG